MEDYKEKYENLIEELKKEKEEHGGYTFSSVIEKIVPKLKENEDERIGEEIINYFKSKYEDSNSISYDYNKWIAWLKKQCEKNPSCNEDEERIRKAIHIYLDWLDGRKDYQPKGNYSIKDMISWLEKQANIPHFTFDDILALQCAMKTAEKADNKLYKQLTSLHDRLHDAYRLENQGNHNEQNFWEKCNHCEYFDGYDLCLHKKNFGSVTDESKENCSLHNFFIEKQGEQKPSDKAESTEHNYITANSEFFQWIYDRLKYVYNENPNVDYMLSLKERIEDMQKPAEWSEEDEQNRQIINKAIWEYIGENGITQGEAWKLIQWLKSLKDRVQPQPTSEWSEETIKKYIQNQG